MNVSAELPAWASGCVDLAQPRLGSRVLTSSDDFFASHDRLLDPSPPVFKPGVYDDNGKWMDGWESRRKRGQGHDHCIVALGCPGRIHGIELDTSNFTGNFVPAASLEGCVLGEAQDIAGARWTPLLATVALRGDARQFFKLDAGETTWTHLRLNAYPDGGIARLRVYGQVHVDWIGASTTEAVDLAALRNGGRAVTCSDAHFGELANLIAPGRGVNMGDGWETRRRREPGFDWGILRLGHPGVIEKLEIDTAHFKGNFAFKVAVYGALVGDLPDLTLPSLAIYWPPLLPPTELTADAVHTFADQLLQIGPVDHLRIDMIPDGGISRLRAWGRPAR